MRRRGKPQLRRIRIVLWLAVATVVGITGGQLLVRWLDRSEQPAPRSAEEVARDLVTGEFALIDHRGRDVTDEDFKGEWLLVFFGYTHCPDVCPTTLSTIALILDQLGDDAAEVQPLFISVDPARDTPAVLADYVTLFDPRLLGLTGTEEQVADAARAYRAYYAKAPLPGEESVGADGDYAMDHTAHLYLMDPDGVYAKVFSPTDTVEKIVGEIRSRLNQ